MSSSKANASDRVPISSSLRKIWEMMNALERRRFLLVLAGMLLVGAIQTAGVGSVAPFMALASNPSLIESNEILNRIFATFGFESEFAFTLAAGVAVLLLIVLSNAIAAGVTWLMLRFVWNVHHRISCDLLMRYLWQPFTFFVTRNSADLATNILSEANSVTAGILIPAMKALSRAVVALGILALLIAVDVKLAVTSLGILGGLYTVTYVGIRRSLDNFGERRYAANARRFRLAGEALQGIKDVKVLGRERAFLTRYASESRVYSRVSASNQIISTLPQYALEVIAFGGMVAILLYLLAVKADFSQVVPIISLYAFAGYRLMPAMQHIFRGLARIRFYGAPLSALHRDLKEGMYEVPREETTDGGTLDFTQGVELQEVEFSYPNADQPAIRHVSLKIPANQTVAFVGSTGCGKTTLVDILMGLLRPQQGQILVDGVAIDAGNARSWQRQIGYVPQEIFLSDESIAQNVGFGIPAEDLDLLDVERASRIANLHDFVMTLPDGYDTVVGDRGVRLSGGQRQRIGIARALYSDPKILIMDEATSALDGVTEDAVMEAIRTLTNEKTIILIAHRLTTVEDAHVIYFMKDGEIVEQGNHADLIEHSADFRAMARLSA